VKRSVALLLLLAAACSSKAATTTTPPVEQPPPSEVEAEDAGSTIVDATAPAKEAEAGLTGQCASAFGDKLTVGFGRIDGIVYAVQKPSDTQCVMPNNDHVIVQVLMNGAVYRLVVNVESNGADPNIRYAAAPHALPAPAFAEGWHTGLALDYPTDLDLHNAAFSPHTLEEAVTKIAAEVKVGDPISVYAQSGAGRPESAHLIHRNGATTKKDGAIVVSPTTQPKFLAFHFSDQTF